MQTIAQGKDAVLEILENDSLRRTDEEPGVYMLQRDDLGNLVFYLAGFTFIGSGTVSLGGNLLNVIDGRLV